MFAVRLEKWGVKCLWQTSMACLAPATVCWAIWLKRNNIVFKGQTKRPRRSIEELRSL